MPLSAEHHQTLLALKHTYTHSSSLWQRLYPKPLQDALKRYPEENATEEQACDVHQAFTEMGRMHDRVFKELFDVFCRSRWQHVYRVMHESSNDPRQAFMEGLNPRRAWLLSEEAIRILWDRVPVKAMTSDILENIMTQSMTPDCGPAIAAYCHQTFGERLKAPSRSIFRQTHETAHPSPPPRSEPSTGAPAAR